MEMKRKKTFLKLRTQNKNLNEQLNNKYFYLYENFMDRIRRKGS